LKRGNVHSNTQKIEQFENTQKKYQIYLYLYIFLKETYIYIFKFWYRDM